VWVKKSGFDHNVCDKLRGAYTVSHLQLYLHRVIYLRVRADQQIDGSALLDLNLDLLARIGISKVGIQMGIVRAIKKLRSQRETFLEDPTCLLCRSADSRFPIRLLANSSRPRFGDVSQRLKNGPRLPPKIDLISRVSGHGLTFRRTSVFARIPSRCCMTS
jgi:hypothetical protein